MLTLKFVFSSPKGNELLTVHSLVVTGFVRNGFFKFIHRIINCGENKLKSCINLVQKLYIVPGLSSITSLLYSCRKSLVWPFHSFLLPLKISKRNFLRPLMVSFFCTFSRHPSHVWFRGRETHQPAVDRFSRNVLLCSFCQTILEKREELLCLF